MNTRFKTTLPVQTLDNANPEAKPIMEATKAKLGFVPNMYGAMANSPGLLATYTSGYDYFRRESGFTPQEQEVVFLTISRANNCEYCMAAHSVVADKMTMVPVPVTDAIRSYSPIPDQQLAALSAFTDVIFVTRGLPSSAETRAFLAAGYTERHVLEIVLAVAVKTLSNYANHLFQTPLDPVFSDRAWLQPAMAAAA